jgi:hypothetical protein
MRAIRGTIFLCSYLLLGPLLAQAEEASPAERLPVPNSVAQTKIVNSIRAQYRDDFAKRTAGDQLSLANNFRAQAALAGNDPVRQYVLLREAREVATNSGNMDAAFAIIDDTAKLFTVDANELKTTVMANAMDRSLISKDELLGNYLKVCDAAMSKGDVQLANQAIILSKEIVSGTRDPAVAQRVRPYDLRLHDARRELTTVIAAANKLKVNPEDAESNLVVGRYICFVQGNWEGGLQLLTHVADTRLRDLATKDLDGPPSPSAMADLADAWWDWPDSKQTPQRSSRLRAAHWYEKAISGLSGEKKTLAEKRIAEAKDPNANK